jgi:hypothetical protein
MVLAMVFSAPKTPFSSLPAAPRSTIFDPIIDRRSGRPRKVTKAMRMPIRSLLDGRCKTVAAAAERAGLSADYCCRALGQPHVAAFVQLEARKLLNNEGALRASRRMIELLDSASDHVSFDTARHTLALSSIKPPEHGGNININIGEIAGYVIDLSGRKPLPDAMPAIEATLQQGSDVDA